ncbi:tail protein [Ignatzschineria indica]|nr:baseplate J/gp47 family protein [Ignatzschineria indica]GGZ77148.1 tail protein [Ignatzschineria indica]
MPLMVPSFDEIREMILNDITSLDQSAAIHSDSDNYIRASSLAALTEGLYAHHAWIARQIFADSADSEFLEKHASTRAIYRKNAVKAEGIATITGEKGRKIPAGTEIKANDCYFLTLSDTTLESNQAELKISAKEPGTKSNFVKVNGILTAAPAGIRSECIVSTKGGTDIESDGDLLARYLEILRRPPAGGNRYDYKRWALEVPGVTNAYVYPLRRGLGTVDIAITSGDDLPSESVINACQAYIDDVRPVTAKHSYVVAPLIKRIDVVVEVQLKGIALDDITKTLKRVLEDHFSRIAPAETLIISQIEALISDQVGVVDRKLIAPSQNLTPDALLIEWYRLGTITVREMK